MDEDLHNIEDLFRDALEGNSEKPSDKVWNNLEKDLDQDQIKRLRGKYNLLKKAAAALVVLLAISVYVILLKEVPAKSGNGLLTGSTPTLGNNFSEPGNQANTHALNSHPGSAGKLPQTFPSPKIMEPKVGVEVSDSGNGNTASAENGSLPPQKALPGKPALNFGSPNQSSISTTKNKSYTITSNATGPEKHSMIQGSPSQQENSSAAAADQLAQSTIRIWGRILLKDDSAVFSGLGDQPIADRLAPQPSIARLKQEVPKRIFTSKRLGKLYGSQKNRPFYLTPFFSPDFAWYRLQNDNVGNQADSAGSLEKDERHEYSYSFGILAEKMLSTHFSLQTGLTLSNTNLTLEPKHLYAQTDNTGIVKYRINTSSGYGYVLPSFSQNPAPGDSILMYTSVHSLQYLGLPVVAAYSLRSNRFTVSLKGGVSLNLLTRAKLEMSLANSGMIENETINNLVGIKRIYLSGLAGAGVDYQIHPQMSLSFQPTFRFALNSIDQHATVKSYPMTFGLLAGLKMEF